jgi:hypothetical protein
MELVNELKRNYDYVTMINDAVMSSELFLAALKRMKQRIEAGLPLEFYDDTTPGAKNTYCSWGMCSDDPEQWPYVMYHTWPLQFLEAGRIAPIDFQEDQWCPFDDDEKCGEFGDASGGCFYRCRIFQEGFRPAAAEAIELYAAAIYEEEEVLSNA